MSNQIQLRRHWALTTAQVLTDKSKTRQFHFLCAQQESGFQILVEAAEPQAELAAEQLLVIRAGWRETAARGCQAAAELPISGSCKEMRVWKLRLIDLQSPCSCPRAVLTLGFSADTVQPQVRGITQCCFLPQCQKFNFEAWSRFYLNSKLPFEDVLVIFNQIAEAIHSKTHETFKSDFLPSRNSHTTNTQFLWAGGIIG